jgi:hypothetical protein
VTNVKNILIAMFALALSACGAYNEKTAGIEEETILILRSESLVGLTIEITPDFSRLVAESDLTKFTMGLAGVADRENQKLETIALKVEGGTQQLTIRRNGAVIYDRELYFTHGQTRELWVRL